MHLVLLLLLALICNASAFSLSLVPALRGALPVGGAVARAVSAGAARVSLVPLSAKKGGKAKKAGKKTGSKSVSENSQDEMSEEVRGCFVDSEHINLLHLRTLDRGKESEGG